MSAIKPAVRAIWASSAAPSSITDPDTVTAGFTAAGWPLSGVPPSRQYFNWFFNYCSNAVQYLIRRGISDWDTAETYSISDVVLGPNGIVYQSLQNANAGNSPAASPAFWGGLNGYALTGSLGGFVTAAQLAVDLSAYVTTAALSADLSNYATIALVNSDNAATLASAKSFTTASLANYETISNLTANYPTYGYLSANYWTAATTNAQIQAALASYESIAALNTRLASYSTTAQVNAQLAAYSTLAYVQANYATDATVAANLASAETYARGTSSLAANGYQRLPSGLLVQWGTVNCTGGSSGTAFNFPTAFSTGFFIGATARNTNPQIIQAVFLSGAEGELFVYNGGLVSWFAIGI